MTVVSGDGQRAQIFGAFAAPLVVALRDADGGPLAGVEVLFSAPQQGPGATLEQAWVITDAQGRAGISLLANSLPGAYTVRASAASLGAEAEFRLTNAPVAIYLPVVSAR
jgi:hypothetical protein